MKKVKIDVIGAGMGTRSTMTVEAIDAIKKCDCIIGGTRMVTAFGSEKKDKYFAHHPQEILSFLEAHPQYKRVAVVVSGDTGFFSLARKLSGFLDAERYEVRLIPGVNSVSCLAARLGIGWGDAAILSLHGRDEPFMGTIMTHRRTFLLTGGDWRVQSICQELYENGFGDCTVSVGENLSYPEERVVTDTVAEIRHNDFDSMSVMLVENPSPITPPVSFGIPDDQFIRGEVPMTKSEVRVLSLSKLQLERDSVVWDVGAGTGSVSVECGLHAVDGIVYAVEKSKAGCALIEQNKEKFSLHNIHIVKGTAPVALLGLRAPDCVFIGGSGGHLEEIIDRALERNSRVRLVVNALTLETLETARRCLLERAFEQVEIIQAAITRTKNVGKSTMLVAGNPVFILSATGKGESV